MRNWPSEARTLSERPNWSLIKPRQQIRPFSGSTSISQLFRSFARRVSRSELVTMLNPIKPIADRLLCLLIRLDWFQLGQREGKSSFFPCDSNEHFAIGFVRRSQPHDFYLLAFAQGRACPAGGTPGAEGKTQTLFQIAVPSHCPLLGAVGIHDDLLLDAVLPLFVLLGFSHVWMGAQSATEHDANLRDQPEDGREWTAYPRRPFGSLPKDCGLVYGRCSGSYECDRTSALREACGSTRRSFDAP